MAEDAGAVFQVAWEIGKMVKPKLEIGNAPFLAFSGVTAGMAALYMTGLLIK